MNENAAGAELQQILIAVWFGLSDREQDTMLQIFRDIGNERPYFNRLADLFEQASNKAHPWTHMMN
jgi:hypothetical protein